MTEQEQKELIRRVKMLMRRKMSEGWSINAMAKDIGINSSHLTRVWNQAHCIGGGVSEDMVQRIERCLM